MSDVAIYRYPGIVTDHSPTFLTAEWRHLAMFNYEIDPKLLNALVPYGTDLDQWSGRTFVSLVGFRFLRTRVLGIMFPFHCNFSEVNLRFYVCRREGTATKRGVAFVREIVPRRIIASVASALYGERYVALPMSHRIQSEGQNIVVEYGWELGNSKNTMKLTTNGSPALPTEDSVEQFISEHYWGYASPRGGGTIEYEVRHPQWKVWQASNAIFTGSMKGLYGAELGAVLERVPDSAFLAEGSAVSVHRGERLTDV